MGLEFVEFDERSAVEQKFDPLAGGHAPATQRALPFDSVLAARRLGLAGKLLNTFDIFFKTHFFSQPHAWEIEFHARKAAHSARHAQNRYRMCIVG